MADTVDLPGRAFFHWIRVKEGTPLHHRASTQEVDEPFRNSLSHIIRLLPSRRALVLGRWKESGLDEEDALLAALRGRGGAVTVVDDSGHVTEQFERPADDDF